MATWNQLMEEIQAHQRRGIRGQRGQPIAEVPIYDYDSIRRRYLKNMFDHTGRNVLIYYSGWLQKPNIRGVEINDEDKIGFMSILDNLDHDKGLDLILHTPGGEIAATESLIYYLRSIFKGDIRAFVPQLAMSGGTVIACACKEIYMGDHSSLGPIDPQMNIPNMGRIPAHAIIQEFEEAYEQINKQPDKILVWQPILNKYSPGLINRCEKAIDMTKEIVTHSLISVMFQDLDAQDAAKKVERIVEKLGDNDFLKSHDRHLSPKDCSDEIGLIIKKLEDNTQLQDQVLSIHNACMHTFASTPAFKIIENHNGIAFIKLGGQQNINIDIQPNPNFNPQPNQN